MNSIRRPQLRVTVNSRCQRACFYCRPSGESIAVRGRRELDPDSLVRVASAFVSLGIDEIKLTGGDPALWGPLPEAVRRLKTEAGMKHVEVISRHPRIGELAADLTDAGVDLINMSVDTLNPDLHRDITGVDDLDKVLDALRICARTAPSCKVNVVVMRGINDGELAALIEYCAVAGVSTIKLLDVIHDLDQGAESYGKRLSKLRAETLEDLYVPLETLVGDLRDRAVFERVVTQGGLGHPMTSLLMPEGIEVLVKDHNLGAWYGDVCSGCKHFPCHDALMAIRLTSDLRIQFCLLREDIAFSVEDVVDDHDRLAERLGGALGTYETATFHKEEATWLTTS